MAIKLSIISGKGGCGKTTLALSISQMLSLAGLKVLLVDCDTSTHGASYFFENVLKNKNKIMTVADLFSTARIRGLKNKKAIGVKKNIDFIPSSVYLSDNEHNEFDICYDEIELETFFKNYDIVIFDCQAGYTKLMRNIVRISDHNLIVMELDAVSSSSTRTLIAQLGSLLDSANTYQVFNKMTGEDFKVYKYVTHGTFFTNLTPIRYDLSIKKAFAVNSLPRIDIENTEFSNDIFQLTYELFLEKRSILINILIEHKKKVKKVLISEREDLLYEEKKTINKFLKINFIKLVFIFLFVALSSVLTMVGYKLGNEDEITKALIYFLAGSLMGVSLYKASYFIDDFQKNKDSKVSEKILEINEKIEVLNDFIEKNRNLSEEEIKTYNYEDLNFYMM